MTVVMPVYNREKTIYKAIRSVINQTYENWKLLIIDDGSTDRTVNIINPFLHDKRIRLIKCNENKGISSALNTALRFIDTPYFVQLDSDDWFESNTLQELVDAIQQADGNTALFYGNSNLYRKLNGRLKKIKFIRHRQFTDKYDFLQYLTYMVTPRCYRTEAVRAVGGWETNNIVEGRMMEDRLMCLKIVEKYPVFWIDKLLYNCMIHQNQLSGRKSIEIRNVMRKKVISHYLYKWGNEYTPVFTKNKNGYLKIERLERIKEETEKSEETIQEETHEKEKEKETERVGKLTVEATEDRLHREVAKTDLNDKLKILYCTVDQKNYVKENREYFKREIAKLDDVHVEFITKGGEMEDILSKLNFTPDFIYMDDLKKTKPLLGLDRVNIPKGFLYTDLHGNHEFFRSFVEKNKIDLIFSLYRDAFSRFHPQYTDKFVWLPHHVYTPIFKDYGLRKRIDYLLMGVISKKTYPFRAKMAQEMKGVKGFVRHKHPGYRYFTEEEKAKALIGENYAREINRAKIFLTDDSIYKYPIAKYYEVAACNTLVLGSASQELADLGFVDKETFVAINEDNYFEKAKYYLKHEDIRLEIAKRGYEMVRENHSTAIRVKEFVNCISRFVGKESKIGDNLREKEWVKLYGETPSHL